MSSNSIRVCVFLLIAGLFSAIHAQDDPSSVVVQLPEVLSGTNWKASSGIKTLSGDQLLALPDADLLAEYGLAKLHVARYTDGKSHLVAESFELL